MFLIMSQVTATPTTAPMTIVCTRASSISVTATMASMTVGLAASGQYDVVLILQLIPCGTIRGYVGLLTTVPQQQQPQPQMPS